MTERRCIAMGRGAKDKPHFNLYDVDTHTLNINTVADSSPQALIIKTAHGFHVITCPEQPITDRRVLDICDPKCPGNAVRFYPHDDLELIKRPTILCRKVSKIYESIFNLDMPLPTEGYLACDQPLKFGIYIAAKDGIKLTGPERHLS